MRLTHMHTHAQEDGLSYTLKVNIEDKTAHVSEGVAVGLREERERTSAALGRTALFKGATALTELPPYLTLQMMRFFFRCGKGTVRYALMYAEKVEAGPGAFAKCSRVQPTMLSRAHRHTTCRRDNQQKAKILKKIPFSLEFDAYEFCSDALKKQLEGPRQAFKEAQDAAMEAKKLAKKVCVRACVCACHMEESIDTLSWDRDIMKCSRGAGALICTRVLRSKC